MRRYEYHTTDKALKLEEWLFILLTDMGFDAEREVLVQVDGTSIKIDKLTPTPRRPRSADKRRRLDEGAHPPWGVGTARFASVVPSIARPNLSMDRIMRGQPGIKP